MNHKSLLRRIHRQCFLKRVGWDRDRWGLFLYKTSLSPVKIDKNPSKLWSWGYAWLKDLPAR